MASVVVQPPNDRLKLGLDRLEVPLGLPPDVQLRRALAFEHTGSPAFPAECPQFLDPPDGSPAGQELLQGCGADLRPAQEFMASEDGLQVEHDQQELGAALVLPMPFRRSPPDD